MAAESASTSLGPRYAPDDPTLVNPWKGLIDGSTGVLYYWNPETNVTQYERPASLPPPLPPGPPPTASSVPKLAPIPVARTLPLNGTMPPTGQQMLQQVSQQVPQQQPVQQMPHHQASHQLQYQQSGQQMAHQTSQQQQQQQQQQQHQHQQHQQQHQQSGQQMPHQQSGQQMLHQQLQQYPYMQLQQMSHQQFQYVQAQQMSRQQGQQPLGQQTGHQQGQQAGFTRVEETGPQQSRQIGFSSVQVEQGGGVSSSHNLPSGVPQVQIPQMGVHPPHSQQHSVGASSVMTRQNNTSLVQLHPGTDSHHRQQHMGAGPITPNLMGLGMVRSSMPAGPPIGLKIGYEEDQHGKMGNEFYSDGSKEVSMMTPQQPKLAAIPLARDQQEMRMGSVSPQFVGPSAVGGPNMAPGRTMPHMFSHGFTGQPLPSGIPMRPPHGMLSPSDFTDISAADMYCKQHEVSAMGDNVPAPFMTFETTGFPPEILREMHLAGFSSPTPIQAQTWPVALQGRDIVAIAKTGSGKTLGYLIPAFIHLRRCRNNTQMGPTVLVLAPTRELATQIQDEAIKFGGSSRVSCTCLYGGTPKGPQLREVERGADIIVATPGRLNDILEMGKINFHQVSFVVLDEADRMLDMGFEPQIRKIVNEIPPRRQTLMYTATWPKEVRKIAGDLLVNPVQVNIGSVDELAANKAITQYVEVVSPMERQRRLEQILRAQERGSKIIIFCSTKRLCDQLARTIGRSFGAAAIHGDKSQGERDWVLNQFRSGKTPILVATDVAARGLDIKDIRVVINYDFPTGIEDYVHRIGRTGRAGATGVSYTFFSDQDWKYAADLVKVLERANQQVPPQLREMAVRGGPVVSRGRGGISRWDSGGGRWDSGSGRGMREGGGGRWDSGGGRGMRDSGGRFGGRGGRDDLFGGRGNRGRGPGGPGGWGRNDRFAVMDGRGRYDNRRGNVDRSRDRSYSRSPDRVRTWSYDRSRSQSRSWSRSYSRSPSRSRSRSHDRFDRPRPRSGFDVRPPSGFDILPPSGLNIPPRSGFDVPPPSGSDAPQVSGFDGPLGYGAGFGVEVHPGSEIEAPAVPGFTSGLAREMSPMSPGPNTGSLPNVGRDEVPAQDGAVTARPGFPEPLGDL